MGMPLLQLPKTKEFYGGLQAAPGNSLVYLDFSAVEPHVLAYFSRDPRMLQLYGKGAKPNDIYIFFGSGTAQYGELFRSHGYDPDSPTKEAIKAVKTHCPDERQVCKKLVLLLNYMGRWRKAQSELALAGFTVTDEEAQQLYNDYWSFFSGIKRFSESLKRQWQANGGWILGMRGQPICVPKPYKYYDVKKGKQVTVDYTKDLVNRYCQSGGHIITMRYIYHINQMRLDQQVPAKPFHVDGHDATCWEVPNQFVDQVVQIYLDALDAVNVELAWDVTIKGVPKVGTSLADFIAD